MQFRRQSVWEVGQVSLQPSSAHESTAVFVSVLKGEEQEYKELEEGEERGGR
jgi:hypothetical protein